MFRHLIVWLLAFIVTAPCMAETKANRPNILWLIAEDFGPHLSSDGTKEVWTPNLDQFIPSATTAGHSDNLWRIEQTAMAIANGYFVGTINRVGREAPWNIGEFYGSSYFCNPYGKILAEGSRDHDELIIADLDLDMIEKVRAHWQFYRDRRPDIYSDISHDVT